MSQSDDKAVSTTTTTVTTTTTTTTTGGPAPGPAAGPRPHTAQSGQESRMTSTSEGETGTVTFQPNDENYPRYKIVFKGNGQTVGISGPHTDMLSIGEPSMAVRVSLTHNQTSDGPNLTVQITRVTQ